MKKIFLSFTLLFFGAQYRLFAQGGGNAMQFTASLSHYVNVPFNSGLRPASTVTLEAWINTNWQAIGQVAMVGNTETGGYEFDVNSVSGGYAIMFEVHRNGSYGNPYILCSTLSSGWHHFAGTYDGQNAKLFVDGNLAATNDAGAPYAIHYSSFNNDIIIGAEAYSGSTPAGSYFTGQLDEVRIWNHVRTQTEIQNNMNNALTGNETGLLAYYKMDDPIGSSTLTDNSGNGYTGNVHGATFAVSSIVLPVELLTFSVTTTSSAAELNWKTASEINNAGFEIERSRIQKTEIKSQNEQKTWVRVGFMQGEGNSNSPKEYSFLDKSLSAGKYLYRLKQIDHNGKFTSSREIEAEVLFAPTTLFLEQNYPNPFNPSTIINYQLPVSSYVTMKVFDILGKEVALLVNETKEAGTYSVQFNGAQLPSGVYFYQLRAGNSVQTKKLQLLK